MYCRKYTSNWGTFLVMKFGTVDHVIFADRKVSCIKHHAHGTSFSGMINYTCFSISCSPYTFFLRSKLKLFLGIKRNLQNLKRKKLLLVFCASETNYNDKNLRISIVETKKIHIVFLQKLIKIFFFLLVY